jgi:hypothetical protein
MLHPFDEMADMADTAELIKLCISEDEEIFDELKFPQQLFVVAQSHLSSTPCTDHILHKLSITASLGPK